MFKQHFMAISFATLTLGAGHLWGQTTTNTAAAKEVVITATRTNSTLNEIGGNSVTIIDAETIQAKQLPTVAELLKFTVGLDVFSNGGLGSTTSSFMRGAQSKDVLVMIDGVMLNDASSPNRSASLANITTDAIERVEIVRGAQSVLYGSNAAAGVINIITKKGQGSPKIQAGIEGGSYNTKKMNALGSGNIGAVDFSIQASGLQSDGFSSANDRNDRISHQGNTDEKDAYRNQTQTVNLGYTINADFDLRVSARHVEARNDYDDFGPGYTGDRFDYLPPSYSATAVPKGKKDQHGETNETIYSVKVHNLFFSRALESSLTYNSSDIQRDNFDNDGDPSFDYHGKMNDLSWQGTLALGSSNLLTLGLGQYHETFASDTATLNEEEARIGSYWLQDQAFLFDNALVLVIGGRNDDHDKFGSKSSFRFAPAYTVKASNTKFKASYGTGFRAPSLYELYETKYGNADLEPEKNRSWDAGLEQGIGNSIRMGITWFDMHFTDRIGFVTDPISFKSNYAQIEGENITNGAEVFAQFSPTQTIDLGLNSTYTYTEDAKGKRLPRVPQQKSNVNLLYKNGDNCTVDFSVLHVGERDEIPSSRDKKGKKIDRLEAYSLANLAVSHSLTKNFRVYGRVDNLTDTEYEEVWSYATAGRSAYLGLQAEY